MSLQKMCCRKIKKELGMYYNWGLGFNISLGDYGLLDRNHTFTKYGNILEEYEIDAFFENGNKVNLECKNQSKLTFDPKIAFSTIKIPISVDLNIKFLENNSVCFLSQGCISHQFRNLGKLGEELIKRYPSNWDENYVIVIKTTEADKTTVLISKNKGGEITLNANLIGPIMTYEDFFINGAGISIKPQCNIDYRLLAQNKTTPLFSLAKLETKVFKKIKIKKYDITMFNSLTDSVSTIYRCHKKRRDIVNTVASIAPSTKIYQPSQKIKKSIAISGNSMPLKKVSVDLKNIKSFDAKPIKGIGLSTKRNSTGVRVVNKNILRNNSNSIAALNKVKRSDEIRFVNARIKFKNI